jgi:hypothetical protein
MARHAMTRTATSRLAFIVLSQPSFTAIAWRSVRDAEPATLEGEATQLTIGIMNALPTAGENFQRIYRQGSSPPRESRQRGDVPGDWLESGSMRVEEKEARAPG